MMNINKEIIVEALMKIINPEDNKDIVNSGLVKNVQITEKEVFIQIELIKPNSPIKATLEKVIKEVVNSVVKDKLEIKINFAEKQKQKFGTEDSEMPHVKNIIAIASGKGGVGKSTIATNLAISLAKTGASVGLIDADIFGPSLPKMFGTEGERPLVKKIGGKDIILPIEKYGIKMLSIGFFIEPDSALIWRGPMATNALKQLILDAAWGKLDYLLIDLPPGTSDIHLTLVQTLSITGAVIVTTPQKVALADAVKGIGMFRSEKINVPILGIVENMSWFTPVELPDNKYYIFGKGGAAELSIKFDIPVLGQIPLIQSICENGDEGKPTVIDNQNIGHKEFEILAQNVLKSLSERNQKMAPTEKVEINPDASCSV